MPEHVDRLGDIERGWTIYCDDDGPRFTVEGHEPTPAAYAALDRVEVVPAADHQGAVEALRRGKPLQGNAPEPVVSHGWVTVFFRPVDWRVLDRLRGER
jgi:hypothetical protein